MAAAAVRLTIPNRTLEKRHPDVVSCVLDPAVGVTPDATQGCTLWGWCQRSNVPILGGLLVGGGARY
jgi:hypothetical protein